MVIYLDDYRKARAMKPAGARHHEAPRSMNWNVAVSAFALSCHLPERKSSPRLSEDFAGLEVKGFLDCVYALASQI